MVEEFANQAIEPLERAKIVANEARNITDLPQYLDQRLGMHPVRTGLRNKM